MGLVLPVPSSEPGPAWATELITAWGLVDSHDHTTGKGVRLTQNSILFTADFSANFVGINTLKNLTFTSQVAFAANQSLYVNSSGNLFYVDNAGNQIQLTLNGALNQARTGNFAVGVLSPASAAAISINVADAVVVYIIDTTTFAPNVTMPSAVLAGAGRLITIKDKNFANTHNITVLPQAAQTLDGTSSNTISLNKGVLRYVSDGVSNWASI